MDFFSGLENPRIPFHLNVLPQKAVQKEPHGQPSKKSVVVGYQLDDFHQSNLYISEMVGSITKHPSMKKTGGLY